MNIKLKTNSKKEIHCTIDLPEIGIDKEKFSKFIDTITNANFLIRINEKTGLEWKESLMNIKYSDEAEFEGLYTMFVDYNRGSRAVSSAIHESFHLMLRQIKWTENSVVKAMIKKYPELVNSSSHGLAYKMEQMFAYLLQNEVYQEIAQDLKFDANNDYWSMDFIIRDFLPYEFDTPFLSALAITVIDVWNSNNRSNDIFELIREVASRMDV